MVALSDSSETSGRSSPAQLGWVTKALKVCTAALGAKRPLAKIPASANASDSDASWMSSDCLCRTCLDFEIYANDRWAVTTHSFHEHPTLGSKFTLEGRFAVNRRFIGQSCSNCRTL